MTIHRAPHPESIPLEPHPALSSREAERGDVSRARELGAAKRRILNEIRKRIVGQDEVIDLLLTCVFARSRPPRWATAVPTRG